MKKIFAIMVTAVFSQLICRFSLLICPAIIISEDIICSDIFRSMNIDLGSIVKLSEFAKENNMSQDEILALYFCDNYRQLSDSKKNTDCDNLRSIYSYTETEYKVCSFSYKIKQKQAFDTIKNACNAVFSDLKYFPVAENVRDSDAGYSYINSWYGERSFGGNRRHEGTDIMAEVNERGLYPVVSVTDGVVEKIGWLKLGGYRIGIRAQNGGYFYYAHLDSYSKSYSIGDVINAGEIIGMMGDSGYGPEGTVGKFDVHLHFGIYIKDFDGKEISINPYNVLKSLENSKKQESFY